MKPEVFLSYFLNDPLIGSFFLRGDYITDDSGKDLLVDEMDYETNEEVVIEKVQTIQQKWLDEYRTKNAFLLFFIDLLDSNAGKDIIYELKRLDKAIGTKSRKVFYSTFLDYLNDTKRTESCIAKLATPRSEPRYSQLIDQQSPEFKNQLETNKKRLTKLVSKAFPEIKSFIEVTYLKPKYSYNLKTIGSSKEGELSHPFIWCGDNTKLAELILYLSLNGWLKINERIENPKNLAIAIANIFLQKKGASVANISASTFQSYLLGLDIDGINTIKKEDIGRLKSLKMKAARFSPFKNIDEKGKIK